MTAVRAYMWDMAGREGIILCGRQFMNSLADSSFDEIRAAIRSEPWLDEAFEIGDKFIRTKSKRISYAFTGLDRNIDSVKSKARILLCWVDEAEPVTDEAWTKLIPTLREEDSELWTTWNPESKRSPTHKRFRLGVPDPRVKIVEINWRDNPWFPAVLERARQRDMRDRPEQYNHIWEGDFAEVFEGAYYVRELIDAKDQGRIRSVAVEPSLPVHTAWDLGIGDSTALWCFQLVGREARFVNHYEANGKALGHYAEWLASNGYHGDDWVPHDAKVRELGTGLTRVETLTKLKRKPRLVPDHKVEDGINAVREVLPRCWFDQANCEDGLDALRQYRTEFDDKGNTFKDKPLHDWTSHSADAFRYFAMAYREIVPPKPKPEPAYDFAFDPQKGVIRSTKTIRELIAEKERARRREAD